MLNERLAAWVVCFFCDLDHLGANARNFAEANLVDLLCGQICGGLFTDAECVICRPIGLSRNAGDLGAGWLVACGIPRQLLVQRRVDDIADGRLGIGRQPCKVCLRNAFRAFSRIRAEETRLANVRCDQAADGAFKPRERFAGLCEFTFDRDIGDCDILVIDSAILRKPRIVAFEILRGLERQIPRHAGNLLMPTRIGREVDGALPELIALYGRNQRPLQYSGLHF